MGNARQDALGMRIVRADGTPISYGIALGRAIMQMLLQNCTCNLFYYRCNQRRAPWLA